MTSMRRAMQRTAIALTAIALLVPALPAVAASGNAAVTGVLTISDATELGPDALAVVVLIDRTPNPQGGTVIGAQEIRAPGRLPISFSVAYDGTTIQPAHSYQLFATLQDKGRVWQNLDGQPVGPPPASTQRSRRFPRHSRQR